MQRGAARGEGTAGRAGAPRLWFGAHPHPTRTSSPLPHAHTWQGPLCPSPGCHTIDCETALQEHPRKHLGPPARCTPRHRGTTSLGTLGLPQVTQQEQRFQAQKPHEGSPDNTPRPPGRDLGTLWPPQPAGHSRRPPLPQGPRLWPRTHTQTAPTPVKPTSSSNSGWAWQRRAPAPFSSRQEGELSGNGGRPSQYLRTSSRGLACEEPAQHWGVEAARPGVGRGSGPGHSGPDVAVPRPGVGGLLHATVPPGAQCRAQSLDSSALRVTHGVTGG